MAQRGSNTFALIYPGECCELDTTMLLKATNRFVKTAQVNTLLIFGLQLLTLSSVAFGLSYLVHELDFGFAFGVTLVALLNAWWLANRRWHGSVSAIFLSLLGSVLIFFWVGQLLGLTLAWLGALGDLLWQTLQRSTPIETLAYQAAA